MKIIQFAVVSAYNKDNLTIFMKKLYELNPKLKTLATSNSYSLLKTEIKNLTNIEEFTGYAESPEGLVKTLHPKIFFGFLGDSSKEEHQKTFKKLNTQPIDLLVSNLYPFWEVKDKKLSIKDLTNYWDIGGPSMIMAAIKGNHTIVLTDPNDYKLYLEVISDKTTTDQKLLKQLNLKALKYVVNYHKMIGEYFEKDFELL